MTYNRASILSQYGTLYVPYDTNKSFCFYCGDLSECIDHSPSLVDLYNLGIDKLQERKVLFYTVPCCNECNRGAAHGYQKLGLRRRAEWLTSYYTARYNKVLHTKIPAHEELMEYGPNLRQYILTGLIAKESMEKRLEHLNTLIFKLLDSPEDALCDNCGRILSTIPYTKRGDRRRFCSSICRSKWWAKAM
jgi:hypothetical protein